MRKQILLFPMMFLLLIGCRTPSPLVVKPIDEQQFQQLVQQRAGKILVVNIWATWCAPCREEFPELVRLADFYHSKSVEFVGISVDFPDEISAKILPFLKANHANFANYVKAVSDDEEFINIINRKWSGALPATAVYDMEGKQRYFKFGKINPAVLKKQIDALL